MPGSHLCPCLDEAATTRLRIALLALVIYNLVIKNAYEEQVI